MPLCMDLLYQTLLFQSSPCQLSDKNSLPYVKLTQVLPAAHFPCPPTTRTESPLSPAHKQPHSIIIKRVLASSVGDENGLGSSPLFTVSLRVLLTETCLTTHISLCHRTHQTCWHPGVPAAETGLIAEVLTQGETTRSLQRFLWQGRDGDKLEFADWAFGLWNVVPLMWFQVRKRAKLQLASAHICVTSSNPEQEEQ